MEKETLKEAAEKRIPTSTKIWDLTETRRSDFIAGAEWQAERMYSDEEVKKIVCKALESALVTVDLEQWFKQFKKK